MSGHQSRVTLFLQVYSNFQAASLQCVANLNCIFVLESLFPVQKVVKKREKITFKVNDFVEDKVEVPDDNAHCTSGTKIAPTVTTA